MTRAENIKYMLRLYQTRSKLQAKGIVQPIKLMIGQDLWKTHKNNNNYLSGRITSPGFLSALIKLNNIEEDVQ